MSPCGAACVTASVGVASTDRVGYDFPELMKTADAALYEAKARGRNEAVRPQYAALRGRIAS
jgi:diguanylate cyclase (GGDEF)-like protein